MTERFSGRLFSDRGLIPVLVLILAAVILTMLLLPEDVPEYPTDLVSYLGGLYAAIDGSDPYDADDALASLHARGFENEVIYGYVYSPPFLLFLEPVRIIPYRFFRTLWTGLGIVSVWAALFLLCLRLEGKDRILLAVLGACFLLVSSVLYDSLYWGQVSGLLLLAVSVLVYRGYRGIVAGVAASAFLFLKVGFIPFILFLRGRRAWSSLGAVVLLLAVFGLAVYGTGSYAGFVENIGIIGKSWNVDLANNVSIAGAAGMAAGEWLAPGMDLERARTDHDYRLEIAALVGRRVRLATTVISALIVLGMVFRLGYLFRKGFRPDRNFLLALAALALLVLLPFVWLHYGLILLVPLWYLVHSGRRIAAAAMTFSLILWGLPLKPAYGFWTEVPGLRALILLGWIVWLLTAGVPDRDSCPVPRPYSSV